MCPACLATAAMIVAGVASAAGATALVVNKLRVKSGANLSDAINQSEGEQNGTENRVTQ